MADIIQNWTIYTVKKAIQNGVEYNFPSIDDDLVNGVWYIETDSFVRFRSNEYWGTGYTSGTHEGTGWTGIVISEGYYRNWIIHRLFWGMFYVNGRFFILPLKDTSNQASANYQSTEKVKYGKLSDTEYWMVYSFREGSDYTYVIYKIDVTASQITYGSTSTEPVFVEGVDSSNSENLQSTSRSAQINAGEFTMNTYLQTRAWATNIPWAMYARMRLIPVS